MTALRLTLFQGLRPRTNPRLLPESAAQTAENVDIRSGTLAPVNRPLPVYVPVKTLPALAVFKAINGAASSWLTWPFDVDAVKMPMPADVEARFAWTGDGEPRWGAYSDVTSGAGNDYPKLFFALGIPNPTAKPSATPSGGASGTQTRFYVATFWSQDGEESGPSPVSDAASGYTDAGATWAISNLPAFPSNSDGAKGFFSTDTLVVSTTGAAGTITGATNAGPIVITETAHGRATGDKVTIAGVGGNTAANNTYANPYWTITYVDANTYSLDGSVGNGAYTAGGSVYAVSPHWLRAADEVVLSATTLDVASVPSAYTFKVAGDYSAATTWARVAPWNTTNMKMRLYRTAGTAAGFQLVEDDVKASASYNAGTNTYSDTLLDTQIPGDELITDGWQPPPAGLRGLIVTAAGTLAGFVGNTLRLSVPGQGHTWPDDNSYVISPDIVAIAAMGSAIGVGTTGVPHVAIGSDPAAMAMIPANIPYPCLSKRSMVSDGGGVLYASNAGLVRLDQSAQASIFTEPWFDGKTWAERSPSTMVCAVGPSRIYALYETGGRRSILIWDMTIGELTENAIEVDELFVDESTGDAYVSDADGISALVGGAYPAQLVWRSKEYVLPKPANFGAAKVRFSAAIDEAVRAAILAEIAAVIAANEALSGDLKGSINSHGYNVRRWNGSLYAVVPEMPPANTVTFTLFTDGAERYTRVVENSNVFRLPSGYLAGRVSVQVSSACEIDGIEMAGTPQELAQV